MAALAAAGLAFSLVPAGTARAGVGVDLAVGGCGAVVDSMITTQVAVDPHYLYFEALQDGDIPPPQSIAVDCFAPDGLGDCGGSVSVNQPWLVTDRSDFFGVDRVDVLADSTGLEPGTYEGRIHLQYDFIAIDDEEDVDVELVVVPAEGAYYGEAP